MVNPNAMVGALPLLARALGRQMNTEVVIGGTGAYVVQGDKPVIHLPTLPMEDPNVSVLAFGYLGHEAGHIKHTDQSQKGGLTDKPLHRSLYQICEDCRMERLMGEEYPGVRSDLARLVERLVADGDMAACEPGAHPGAVLTSFALHSARFEVLGQQALQACAKADRQALEETFSPGLTVKIRALLSRIRTLTCTRDSVELATALLAVIEEEQTDESQSSPAEPNNPEETQNGESNAPMAEATPEQKQAAQQALEAREENLVGDISEQVAERLSQEAAGAVRREGGGVGVGNADQDVPVDADPSELLRECAGATNALRERLLALLQAQTQSRSRLRSTGTRIKGSRLHRIAAGDPRVFIHRARRQQRDTSVLLLVDRSGSMKDRVGQSTKIELATISALAVAMALDGQSGMKVGVAGFPGRAEAVVPLSGIGDSIRASAGRYAALTADGGTPMAPALWWALDKISAATTSRKVLLVVTDGKPSQHELCRRIIGLAPRLGVEVHGLGVGTESVRDLFAASCVIQSARELPQAVFGMLQQSLTQVA